MFSFAKWLIHGISKLKSPPAYFCSFKEPWKHPYCKISGYLLRYQEQSPRELFPLYSMQLKHINTQQTGHNHKTPMSSLNRKEHGRTQPTLEKMSLEPKWLLISYWMVGGRGQWILKPLQETPTPHCPHPRNFLPLEKKQHNDNWETMWGRIVWGITNAGFSP